MKTAGKTLLAALFGILVGVGVYYFFFQPKTATITVEFSDPTLEGETVYVQKLDWPDAGKYFKGFSDADGKVTLDGLPVPGKWQISVELEKISPPKALITISLGDDADRYTHVVTVKGRGETLSYAVNAKK